MSEADGRCSTGVDIVLLTSPPQCSIFGMLDSEGVRSGPQRAARSSSTHCRTCSGTHNACVRLKRVIYPTLRDNQHAALRHAAHPPPSLIPTPPLNLRV